MSYQTIKSTTLEVHYLISIIITGGAENGQKRVGAALSLLQRKDQAEAGGRLTNPSLAAIIQFPRGLCACTSYFMAKNSESLLLR